jgi:hypothetical protein
MKTSVITAASALLVLATVAGAQRERVAAREPDSALAALQALVVGDGTPADARLGRPGAPTTDDDARIGSSATPGAQGPAAQGAPGTWSVVPLPFPETDQSMVMDVQMLSPDEGWAVGEFGNGSTPVDPLRPAIWHYSGGQWQLVTMPDPPPAMLWALDMTSAEEGWAVGGLGTSSSVILHYAGGAWRVFADDIPASLLSDVEMVSPDDGWIVGMRSLLRFRAGGWQMVDPQFEGISLDMISADDGWAVGGTEVHHYAAGSWQGVTFSEPLTELEAVDFVNTSSGWIGGGHYLRHIRNGALDGAEVPTANYILDIEMLGEDDGWAVGGLSESKPAVIMHYQGGNWVSATCPISGVLRAVDMVSPTEGWSAGFHFPNGQWPTGVLLHYVAPQVPTPAPSATPNTNLRGPKACSYVQRQVPASAIAAALANPDRVYGWGQRCNPSRPPDRFNVQREWLSLRSPDVPFNPLSNSLQYKCGCP